MFRFAGIDVYLHWSWFLVATLLPGYVASGLLPAPHGSSVLLFVPVDPVQNTVCVLAGFALSTLATRWVRGRA